MSANAFLCSVLVERASDYEYYRTAGYFDGRTVGAAAGRLLEWALDVLERDPLDAVAVRNLIAMGRELGRARLVVNTRAARKAIRAELRAASGKRSS